MKGKPIAIPDPETGCNYAGVVVIKIAVNAAGQVFEAELAPNNQIPAGMAKSNFGSNTCLVQKQESLREILVGAVIPATSGVLVLSYTGSELQ